MKLKSNSSFLYLNCLVLALWVLIRVSYRSQILHQDEYKWALFLENGRLVDFPHPILSPFVYHLFLNCFGIENLRLVPIIISFLGHVLAVLLISGVRLFTKFDIQFITYAKPFCNIR